MYSYLTEWTLEIMVIIVSKEKTFYFRKKKLETFHILVVIVYHTKGTNIISTF